MSDRKLGYILMLLTLALALGFVLYYVWFMHAPLETRTFRFPEVGTLAIEDPVRMSGALVGIIDGFEHDSLGYVLVRVVTPKNGALFRKRKDVFPESIPIRTSSRATVKVKGLMGERYIDVTMGDLNDPLVPKEQIIDGKFEMGPSEAIAYMDLLGDKIIELRDIMLWLRDGKDDGKRPFPVAFNDIMGTVDTLVWKLLTGLIDIEDGVTAGLATALDITNQAVTLTSTVSAKAPEIMENLNSMMVSIDNVIAKSDTIVGKLDRFAEGIENNRYLWGDHTDRLLAQIAELKQIMADLRRDGADLRVRIILW